MSIKTASFVFRFSSILTLLALLVGVWGIAPASAAGILYATPGGTGDCSSWSNSCMLQTALTGAVSGDEIWTAAGTYKPITGTDRTVTFQLKDGVAVFGGFAGTEMARDQRNPAANVTILSGDIDNNDSQTPIITDLATVTGNTTNSYHVVDGSGTNNTAILDGFTITAGYANGTNPNNCGGGVYNNSGSPTLTSVTFSGNTGGYCGGGMYSNSGNPNLTNVTFSSNSSTNGGGMYNVNSGSPSLANVTFSGNSATDSGGGMYNYGGNPSLTNVTFSGNFATSSGGGISNSFSSPTLTNVTISGNSAGNNGGGMYNKSSDTTFTKLKNVIIWGNTAPYGSEITNFYSTSSTLTITYSVIKGGYTGTGNVSSDPLLGALANNGGYTQTMALGAGSSAIDKGTNTDCPATDQRGMIRPLGGICDIGAYETVQAYFADVPTDYWSWSYVERLRNAGITGGCSAVPLNYCPTTPVTRAQMAIFLLRGMHGSTYTPPAATGTVFNDVPLGTFGAAWIEQLALEGITSGCGDGNYCPNTTVSRAQMAIFLVRAKHGVAFVPPTATGVFGDVPIGSFGANFIEQLVTDAITSGCGSGNFCPNTMVKRDSMAVFLVKTFNLP